jgi:hypothetical protein
MTPPTYAESTKVSVDRSLSEIERIVDRWGATAFAYGRASTKGMIGFELHGRQIRFVLPLPEETSTEFTRSETGRERSATAARNAYEQSVKSRWRALAAVIKAKLIAVDEGIVTFEEEFGMHMVLPNGQTVAENVTPMIAEAYRTGTVRPLLSIEAAR